MENRSLDNVRGFAEQEHLDMQIITRNCDSTNGVMDLLPSLAKMTFLHLDPYEIDRKGIDGHTYFDIFIQATQLGMKCLLWYGFMTLEDKLRLDKYIAFHLRKLGIQNVVGSKLIMNNIGKNTISCNPGILGSGLLAGKSSPTCHKALTVVALSFSGLHLGLHGKLKDTKKTQKKQLLFTVTA